MPARDSIKKALQAINAAALPRETKHVLETKLSSLEDQIIALENENHRLKAENERLKVHVQCLQPQTEEISQDTIRVLKFLFDRAGNTVAEDITRAFKWKQGAVDSHIGVLLKKRFIRESSMGMQTAFGSSQTRFGLTSLGRRYIIQFADH